MACYHAYTHKDLDGAVSLLTLLWALPEDTITYDSVNNLQIDNIKKSLEKINKPCQTFILDLSLREEFLPDLDRSNITFIDHHDSSVDFIPRFNKAKIIHKVISSNALLMAQIFKGENFQARSDSQKTLIALADDYDCYRLEIPESYDLNILFWSEYKNNFSKFIKDYFSGFKGFSVEQKKAINFIKKEATNEADKTPTFEGYINFGNKKKKTLAIMSENFSNITNDILMQRHRPDVFFFINSKSEKVSIRQYTKEDPINVGNFAEKICDGGGHVHAGGGIITPLFMEVTKNLVPVNR
jgi:oligoribonuclease NrnB/cAMP/cGMP phosphodiesterase (DHH superfamily)